MSILEALKARFFSPADDPTIKEIEELSDHGFLGIRRPNAITMPMIQSDFSGNALRLPLQMSRSHSC